MNIILTGATSGLGNKIFQHLVSKGFNLITISRTPFSESQNHYICNVNDYEKLKVIYKDLLNKKIKPNALINAAGTASMNLALTTPKEIIEKVITTNLTGTIFVNQIFAPLLIRSPNSSIINFSTIAVPLNLEGESVYVASKAGVEAFSRTLAKELAAFKIRVNCIAPGPIKTNLLKGISQKQIDNIVKRQIIKRLMNQDDILPFIDILLDPKMVNLTGQVLHVGGV